MIKGDLCSGASSMTGDICRICLESQPDLPLVSPCHCSGSQRYVHQQCLQLWIKSSQTKSCEVCRYNFIMETRMKPICKVSDSHPHIFKLNNRLSFQWETLDMTPVEQRRLLCSLAFHIIALSCVLWALYVLIEKMVIEASGKEAINWAFW